LQPSLTFEVKTEVDSRQNNLKAPANNNRSSLLFKIVNYALERFITLAQLKLKHEWLEKFSQRGLLTTLHFAHNLQIRPIS